MQETFEKVSRHLFEQGRPSVESGTCLYRGPNGTKCAIGCLIPDELYVPDMDGGYVATALLKYWPSLQSQFDMGWSYETWVRFFTRLQRAHDSNPTWSSSYDYDNLKFNETKLREDLSEIASEFDLDASFISDLQMNNLRLKKNFVKD
jgi:hypothetical protein